MAQNNPKIDDIPMDEILNFVKELEQEQNAERLQQWFENSAEKTPPRPFKKPNDPK